MKSLLWIAAVIGCSGRGGAPQHGPVVPTTPTAGVVLGRIPSSSAYRIIACASGPNTRRACEDSLGRLIGVDALSRDGDTARITRTSTIKSGDGTNVAVVELDRAIASVVATGGSPSLVRRQANITDHDKSAIRTMVRKLSPKARWASHESFAVTAYHADLDGDRTADTVAVGVITDSSTEGSRYLVGIVVALAGNPFELVEAKLEVVDVVGTLDLDGDGRDEVLLERTGGDFDTITYDYELYRVVPAKQLAMGIRPPVPSEAWQPYDVLEDHNHSDE